MTKKKAPSGFKGRRNTDTKAANAARTKKAQDFAMEIGKILLDYNTQGFRYRKMAIALNEDGKRTLRGKLWSERQVRRLFARFKALGPSFFKK